MQLCRIIQLIVLISCFSLSLSQKIPLDEASACGAAYAADPLADNSGWNITKFDFATGEWTFKVFTLPTSETAVTTLFDRIRRQFILVSTAELYLYSVDYERVVFAFAYDPTQTNFNRICVIDQTVADQIWCSLTNSLGFFDMNTMTYRPLTTVPALAGAEYGGVLDSDNSFFLITELTSPSTLAIYRSDFQQNITDEVHLHLDTPLVFHGSVQIQDTLPTGEMVYLVSPGNPSYSVVLIDPANGNITTLLSDPSDFVPISIYFQYLFGTFTSCDNETQCFGFVDSDTGDVRKFPIPSPITVTSFPNGVFYYPDDCDSVTL